MDRQAAQEALEVLRSADRLLTAIYFARIRLVRQARRRGYTWAEIGAALGTSRQAAWERYARYC
jgi:hypothetical protein